MKRKALKLFHLPLHPRFRLPMHEICSHVTQIPSITFLLTFCKLQEHSWRRRYASGCIRCASKEKLGCSQHLHRDFDKVTRISFPSHWRWPLLRLLGNNGIWSHVSAEFRIIDFRISKLELRGAPQICFPSANFICVLQHCSSCLFSLPMELHCSGVQRNSISTRHHFYDNMSRRILLGESRSRVFVRET